MMAPPCTVVVWLRCMPTTVAAAHVDCVHDVVKMTRRNPLLLQPTLASLPPSPHQIAAICLQPRF